MKNLQTEKTFDVIIVGGGAAGMSAALWCDDLGLSALVLEARAELGGQLLRVYNPIENHLGGAAKNGREMRDIFLRQLEGRKFTLKLSSEIRALDLKRKTVRLAGGEQFSALAGIVIATGVRRRKLKVAGEEKFIGKGIIESGKRDGNSVEDKTAAIIGGGDAAFENALILAGETEEKAAAKKVYLICRGADFRARAEFVKQVLEHPKIEILNETVVREIRGGERLEFLRLENLRTKKNFKLPLEALLIRAGVEPNTEIFRGKLNLDERGYVQTNALGETNVKGIFVAGDIANPISPTVSTAVGMGATVVKAIYERLKF